MIDCSKTENYFNEKLKMTKRTKNGLCEIKCSNCPLCSTNNGEGLPCPEFEMYYPKKAIEAVQRWSDEHPPKTYLSELLKHYPNIELDEDGTPNDLCPCQLGLKCDEDRCLDAKPYCVNCWNQTIPIEDGEE